MGPLPCFVNVPLAGNGTNRCWIAPDGEMGSQQHIKTCGFGSHCTSSPPDHRTHPLMNYLTAALHATATCSSRSSRRDAPQRINPKRANLACSKKMAQNSRDPSGCFPLKPLDMERFRLRVCSSAIRRALPPEALSRGKRCILTCMRT